MSPFNQAQKVLNDLVQHGTAPDNWLVPGMEKSDRNYFQTKGLNRLNAIFSHHLRLRIYAEHQRNIRAVDIGVKQANLVAHLGESNSQIHRQRGLADSTLAGTYGDDGIDSRQRLRPRRWLAGLMRHMCVQGITLQE